MSRLPRDVSGRDLARALRKFGYETVRRTGSHMRLARTEGGEHHITIPDHSSLKVGTLSAILKDIASHVRMTREELLDRLEL